MSSGRRVLITGGGSGLGADLAADLAAAGNQVVIAGRRLEALQQVAARSETIRPIVADVTDEASVAGLFAAAGQIDVVIANAGVAASAPLHRTGLDLWNEMLATNLTGTFLTLREGWRQLRGRSWGRLITIASVAGVRGYPYVAAYTAAKHGAVGLTRAIAQEVAGTGVTANAICPGYLDTDMTQRTLDNIVATTGRTRQHALDSLVGPLGRLVRPDEVTAAVMWLCGAGGEAVNGQAITIDGGER